MHTYIEHCPCPHPLSQCIPAWEHIRKVLHHPPFFGTIRCYLFLHIPLKVGLEDPFAVPSVLVKHHIRYGDEYLTKVFLRHLTLRHTYRPCPTDRFAYFSAGFPQDAVLVWQALLLYNVLTGQEGAVVRAPGILREGLLRVRRRPLDVAGPETCLQFLLQCR